jgi:surface glycoprotein (TIGR04207 family)
MNQKYVAVFLAAIMFMSIFPYLLSGGNTTDNTGDSVEYRNFSSVDGAHVDIPITSLTDGIAVTPPGAVAVQYMDIGEASQSHLQLLVGNTSALDDLYGSSVVNEYSAAYADSTWFELHKISPEVIGFSYYLSPDLYNGYRLLMRQNGYYTVVGSPIIVGSLNTTQDVLDVITGNTSKTTAFDDVLRYAVDDAQLEGASVLGDGADQYYMAWKALDSNTYTRTTVLLNPSMATMENITAYSAAGEEKGLDYVVNTYGNITEVTVTTNASGFFTLASEPVM